MKTRTMLAATALALMALGGAASAHGTQGHGGGPGADGPGAGGPDMMQMMTRMHGQTMGGGMGMMQGGMGGSMSAMRQMMDRLDADGDGTVTPAEAREGLQALVAEYDADGDETLSLAEFETLHSALARETMVDRFQFLDDDGDGQITTGEIVKPADMMGRMQSKREGMTQGGNECPGSGMGQQGTPGRGMMDNN